MSDSEDLVTKVPDRLLERLVSLFLHQNPQLEYRVMLIAARGSESLAVWDSTMSSLQQTLAGWEVQRAETGIEGHSQSLGFRDSRNLALVTFGDSFQACGVSR